MIGLVSMVWISFSALENRLETSKLLAAELSVQIVDENGFIRDDRQIDGIVKENKRLLRIEGRLPIFIEDLNHQLLFPKKLPAGAPSPVPMLRQLPVAAEVSVTKKHVEPFGNSYIVAAPVLHDNRIVGRVVIHLHKPLASEVAYEYGLLAVVLTGGALLGWGVIYFLTKRLVRPIEEVAAAANQLMNGHYDIAFDEDVREKEIYEMMGSIKEMAVRLKQHEALRTMLLAGVTHDLKTPIASISGLLQAIVDDVVAGEEREEFLHISIKEARRLERMVDDLLDFNGFAAGALQTERETLELSSFVREVAYQWQVTQEEPHNVTIKVECSDKPIYAVGDPVRIQQILINLFNNGFHAMQKNGLMVVQMYSLDEHAVGIDVIDQGSGVAEEERELIFERFYRGNEKKHAVRGLGLGLPFSLMLAKAQGGNLFLKHSSKSGSTFTVTLPQIKN